MREMSQSQPIVDRYFMQCLKRLSEDHNAVIKLFTIRSIVVVLVLLINCYISPIQQQDSKSTFKIFLQLMLVQNILQLTRLLYFRHIKIRNKSVLINVANQFRHCLFLQDINNISGEQFNQQQLYFDIDNEWGIRVSSICYDFENMEKVTDVSEEYRQIRQRIGNNAIKSVLETSVYCYRTLGYLTQLFQVGLFIFGAILTIYMPLPNFQTTFLQIFILVQIIFKPKIFLVIILIALLPLIILIFIIYYLCSRKSAKVKLPKQQQVTKQTLTKCSDCAICFQSFAEGQKIIPLACSDMHIFHETCITGWSKIKATCPICRSEI